MDERAKQGRDGRQASIRRETHDTIKGKSTERRKYLLASDSPQKKKKMMKMKKKKEEDDNHKQEKKEEEENDQYSIFILYLTILFYFIGKIENTINKN